MEEFKISEHGIKQALNAVLARTVPMMLIAGTTGIAPMIAKPAAKEEFDVLLVLIPFLALVTGIGLFCGIKLQRANLRSFRIRFDEDSITRELDRTPAMRIQRSEISKIRRTPKGAFEILSDDPSRIILVPAHIETTERLQELLAQCATIEEADPKPWPMIFLVLFPLLVLASFFGTCVASNKVLVLLFGAFTTAALLGLLIVTQQANGIDQRLKRSSWLVLLPLFGIIAVTIIKVLKL